MQKLLRVPTEFQPRILPLASALVRPPTTLVVETLPLEPKTHHRKAAHPPLAEERKSKPSLTTIPVVALTKSVEPTIALKRSTTGCVSTRADQNTDSDRPNTPIQWRWQC